MTTLLQKLADVVLDIDPGDIVLGGKFKNMRMEVEDFGTDELGQPTINGKKLLNFRIEKDLPEDKMSSQTKEEMLEEKKEAAFHDELKKLAFNPTISELSKIPEAARKRILRVIGAGEFKKPTVMKRGLSGIDKEFFGYDVAGSKIHKGGHGHWVRTA